MILKKMHISIVLSVEETKLGTTYKVYLK